MLTTTSHDSVFLRADNSLIDMNYITSFTGMTDKWFYKLISEGHFPKEGANKRGNSSRLTQSFHFFMFESIFSPVNALNQPI